VIQGETARWPLRGQRTYSLQTGAFANQKVGIFRDFAHNLSSRSMPLELDRVYRIRVEIDQTFLRLMVDGEIVAEYEDRFPFPSGYLALYAYYPGKAFANVRVFQRGLPEHTSPLAVGDAFFAKLDFVEAELQYRRVELGQATAELVSEALYKRGLCLLKQNLIEGAFTLWSGLRAPEWQARIDLHRCDLCFEGERHEQVLAHFARVWQDVPSFQQRVIQRWCEYVSRLVESDDSPLERYLAAREQLFPRDKASGTLAARALNALGRYPEVIERFSYERLELCNALIALGRTDEILSQHADISWMRENTLMLLGRFDEIPAASPLYPFTLVARGRSDESARMSRMSQLALAAGDYERVLKAPETTLERVTALVHLGRLEEAVASGHPVALLQAGEGERALAAATLLQQRVQVLHYLAIDAFVKRDRQRFDSYRARVLGLPFSQTWDDFWCDRFVLLPVAAELFGEQGALERSLAEVEAHYAQCWSRRAGFFARFARGEIDEREFLEQPCSAGAGARLWLARAALTDVARKSEQARNAYTRLLDIPASERRIDWIWLAPSLEYFARARLRAL
jgi:hypothetical protein